MQRPIPQSQRRKSDEKTDDGNASDARGNGEAESDKHRQTGGGAKVLFCGIHRLQRESRHQSKQHQTKENVSGNPDQLPDVVVRVRVIGAVGDFLEVNGRGQLGAVRNLRGFVSFEVYGSADLRRRIDIEFVGPDFRGAADIPADVRLAAHGQNIPLYVPVNAQPSGKRAEASADGGIPVNVDVAAQSHDVSTYFALHGDVSRVSPNASIHLPSHSDLAGPRKQVSQNMARYFHVSACNYQVAFDGAGDADLSSRSEQVAVNHFVSCNGHAVAFAKLGGGGLRRQHYRRAQSREHQ